MKSSVKGKEGLSVQEIWDLCSADLIQVEQRMRHHRRGTLPPFVSEVTDHLFDGGGKRFRPLLLILSSWLHGYTGESRILLAAVVEFIHTATLLHDDVIDDAPIRRGRKSPRIIWGNQASILVGDYLYTTALCQALSLQHQEINETLADATRQMAEGELLQLSRNGNLSLTEEDYLEVIGSKTAALMSATCRLGALLGEATEEKKEALTLFGWYLGMAFQLADDTLDYSADSDRLGKSLGNDLQEGKITLPLLHLLRNCQGADLQQVHAIVRLDKQMEKDLATIQRLMLEYQSIQYAQSLAREYAVKARQSLSLYEESLPRQALLKLTDYVVDRDV